MSVQATQRVMCQQAWAEAAARQAFCEGASGGAHVAELLRLGARKGGDARVRQQLAGHAVDGGRGHQEARRQLQVAVVLHHADEARLRGIAQLSGCTAGAGGTGMPGCTDAGECFSFVITYYLHDKRPFNLKPKL